MTMALIKYKSFNDGSKRFPMRVSGDFFKVHLTF
jgi:hypothetical protein